MTLPTWLGQTGSPLWISYLCCDCSMTAHVVGADRHSTVNYLCCDCSMTAHVVGADRQSTVNYLCCDCSVTLPMWLGQTGSPLWITCVVTAVWLCPCGWGRQAFHCELPVLWLQCDCPCGWGRLADRQSTVNYLCCDCMMMMSWCLMSSDVIWHIRDKLCDQCRSTVQ